MDIREKCQPHLWLLTGTGEGHVFAESLLKEGWKITVSVVSDRASIPYEKLNLEKIFDHLLLLSWKKMFQIGLRNMLLQTTCPLFQKSKMKKKI